MACEEVTEYDELTALCVADDEIANEALLNVCVSAAPPLVFRVSVFTPNEEETIDEQQADKVLH